MALHEHLFWGRFGFWGLGFGVWCLGFGVWGLEFMIWRLGFRVWGLGFEVWGGFWVLGFGFWVLYFGCWVWCLVFDFDFVFFVWGFALGLHACMTCFAATASACFKPLGRPWATLKASTL